MVMIGVPNDRSRSIRRNSSAVGTGGEKSSYSLQYAQERLQRRIGIKCTSKGWPVWSNPQAIRDHIRYQRSSAPAFRRNVFRQVIGVSQRAFAESKVLHIIRTGGNCNVFSVNGERASLKGGAGVSTAASRLETRPGEGWALVIPGLVFRLFPIPCSLFSGFAALLWMANAAVAQIGVWETRAPFPLEATEVAAAAVGDKVYVVGGLTPAGSSNRLFIYDAFTDTWREAAPLPLPGGVDHANLTALNGKVYFVGGIRIGSDFVTGRTFEYDPAANTWTERASMPTPRGASGVAALDGRIYVAGGLTASDSVNNFEAFDPAANSWVVLPSMPTARDHLTAQAVGGKFYAIAGRRNDNLRANEEYDPATNRWTVRAPIPTARGGLGSGTIGGRIQVFGGEGPSGTPEGTFRQNEEYDPATNTWRSLTPMPTPR